MKKTVVVVGAGASAEVNLPAGDGLRRKIETMLSLEIEYGQVQRGDTLIWEAIVAWAQTQPAPQTAMRSALAAAQAVARAMVQSDSIDNFVDSRRGDSLIELTAKLAIARAILEAESNSLLMVRQGQREFDHSRIRDTWFGGLARRLRERCTVDELPARLSRIGLVIFNYDRCFEHFLAHDLARYYPLELHDAQRLVSSMEIYHPYGTVGNLSRLGSGEAGIPFGSNVNASQLLEIARQLKTFTEGTNPTESRIKDLRRMLSRSHRLVFLGFAFWSQNIELLMPHKASTLTDRQCLATVKGISEPNRRPIMSDLKARCGITSPDDVLTMDTTCGEFIDQHSSWLSFV